MPLYHSGSIIEVILCYDAVFQEFDGIESEWPLFLRLPADRQCLQGRPEQDGSLPGETPVPCTPHPRRSVHYYIQRSPPLYGQNSQHSFIQSFCWVITSSFSEGQKEWCPMLLATLVFTFIRTAQRICGTVFYWWCSDPVVVFSGWLFMYSGFDVSGSLFQWPCYDGNVMWVIVWMSLLWCILGRYVGHSVLMFCGSLFRWPGIA